MQRNIIKIAISCAGGIDAVAKLFGVSRQAVSGYQIRRALPAERVEALCAAGGNIITPERLVEYMAEVKAEQARARTIRNVEAARGRTEPAGDAR